MAILPKFIAENGTCVKDANTWATPDDGRVYFPMRFGGEKWDPSFEHDPFCEKDICKALFMSMDFLKCLNWRKTPRHCRCCKNDLPDPQICCDCDPCGRVIDRLKEAQLIVADAILHGWRPWQTSGSAIHPEIMVDSMSRSGQSIKFSKPVSLAAIKNGKCAPGSNLITSEDLGQRLHSILKCYLEPVDDSIQFIS